jgi:hypothetical protein
MAEYRAYILDAANHITLAHVVDASDDGDALVKAKGLGKHNVIEVWQSARIVGRITSLR